MRCADCVAQIRQMLETATGGPEAKELWNKMSGEGSAKKRKPNANAAKPKGTKQQDRQVSAVKQEKEERFEESDDDAEEEEDGDDDDDDKDE